MAFSSFIGWFLGRRDPVEYRQGLIDEDAREGDYFIEGDGIPGDSAGIAVHTTRGIELAIDAHYRQGPQLQQWAEGNETHFLSNTGTQSVSNGSQVDNASRAAWSFTYSFLADEGLDAYQFEILFDRDASERTDFVTFTGVVDSDGTLDWYGEDGSLKWSDDEGNANVSQNTRNISFGELFEEIEMYDHTDVLPNRIAQLAYERAEARIEAGNGSILDRLLVRQVDQRVDAMNDSNPYDYSEGEFDIVLRALDTRGNVLVENHAVVHVEDAII